MTSVRFSKLLAVLLAAILMLTLLPTFVFAAEDGAENDTNAADVSATEAAPTEDKDPDAEEEPDDPAEPEKKKAPNWDLIISLSIIGLAVIVFVILYFAVPKVRDAVNKFFREYKSELGKIVWSSWSDVKKNTAVVIIIVAAFSLMIGVLDFLFAKGIAGLGLLF